MKNTFLQVDYDLLSTTKLHSTQKLFIAYIIGWQRNGLVCKETNNTLAKKFGMKYSGIRKLISALNKFDFFLSESIDYDKSNGTSGHRITVNETELKLFLKLEEESKNKSQKDFEKLPISIGEKINQVHEIDIENNEYDIEIDSELDVVNNIALLKEYYLNHGEPECYIKAKITFVEDNESFYKDVFELKDVKARCKYVLKETFESLLPDFKTKHAG